MIPARDTNPRALGVSPGEVIGDRYEIVRLLGVGGTGAVFEARHKAIGRTVALKILLPELAASEMVPRRFLQEAQTANQVRHRNIVEVLDFGDDHGRLYMVMELLRGESLSAFIRREAPVAPGTLVRLLDPILAALIYAHELGIVHRDVKPQNIFLAQNPDEETPTPKLIDFGIAKRIVADDVTLTATGIILGTPAYMAPEQALGSKDVTPAADQYSIAAILFEALTGRVPHQADTYPAMLIAIVSQPPADLRTLRPDLDPRLTAAVMRALDFDPARRFASLSALRETLKTFRHLDQRGQLALPPTTAPSIVSSATRPDGSSAPLASLPLAPLATSHPIDPPTVRKPATRDPREATLSTSPTTTVARPDPTLRIAAAVVIVLALGMVGVAAALSLRAPHGVSSSPPRTASTPTAPARPAPRDEVTFRIDVDPPTANIFLDGELLAQGHAEVTRPRDGRRYQLRITASGYTQVSEVLEAARDARISRVLTRLQPNPAPRPLPNGHTLSPAVPALQRPTEAPPQAPPRPRTDSLRHPHIDRNNPFE